MSGRYCCGWIGVNCGFLPKPISYAGLLCRSYGSGCSLGLIPAVLKAYYNVSEVCVTILMNTVALYIGSYLVSGPMSAGTANPQSDPVLVTLPKIISHPQPTREFHRGRRGGAGDCNALQDKVGL